MKWGHKEEAGGRAKETAAKRHPCGMIIRPQKEKFRKNRTGEAHGEMVGGEICARKRE